MSRQHGDWLKLPPKAQAALDAYARRPTLAAWREFLDAAGVRHRFMSPIRWLCGLAWSKGVRSIAVHGILVLLPHDTFWLRLHGDPELDHPLLLSPEAKRSMASHVDRPVRCTFDTAMQLVELVPAVQDDGVLEWTPGADNAHVLELRASLGAT